MGAVLLLIAAGLAAVLIAANGDEEVLVLVPLDARAAVEEGDTVRVTGTVRDFEVQPGFGAAEDFEDFEGSVAVLAEEIDEVDEDLATDLDLLEADELEEQDVGERVTLVGEVDRTGIGARSFTLVPG